jgi:acyl carrier protein
MRTETNPSGSVAQQIRDFIRREFLFGREDVALSDEQPLIQDGVVDSVGVLQLVGFLERQFDVSIQPDDLVLKNFASISAMADLVSGKARRD